MSTIGLDHFIVGFFLYRMSIKIIENDEVTTVFVNYIRTKINIAYANDDYNSVFDYSSLSELLYNDILGHSHTTYIKFIASHNIKSHFYNG